MSQPQIFINGLGGTYDAFGLILTNASIFPESEAKQSVIDIPGGSGSIDLSEAASGCVVYSDITQTIVLEACNGDVRSIRQNLVNKLSGQLVNYQLSWDPEYTYTGRWVFGDAEYVGSYFARFTIKTRTDPYKHKPAKTMRIQAGGGTTVLLPSGRMRVSPVFECNRPFVVACNGVSAALPTGASKVRGLYLHEGLNVLYANSASSGGVATWADMPATWRALSNKFWGDLQWMVGDKPTGPEYDIYATYDWGDL